MATPSLRKMLRRAQSALRRLQKLEEKMIPKYPPPPPSYSKRGSPNPPLNKGRSARIARVGLRKARFPNLKTLHQKLTLVKISCVYCSTDSEVKLQKQTNS